MRRKPIRAIVRQQVYNKYRGRCAYCGREITKKEMRVDHFTAAVRYGYDLAGDDISNLMPSCATCNNYKTEYHIDEFRNLIERQPEIRRRAGAVRIAEQMGIIEFHPKPILFHYEQYTAQEPRP